MILEKVDGGRGLRHRLLGLESIAPLGGVIWGDYTVYSTKTLLEYRCYNSMPRFYLIKSYNNREIKAYDRENGIDLCLGEFVKWMSKEEQLLFRENFKKIAALVGTNDII